MHVQYARQEHMHLLLGPSFVQCVDLEVTPLVAVIANSVQLGHTRGDILLPAQHVKLESRP